MTNPNIEKVTHNSDNTSVVDLKNGLKLHIKYTSSNDIGSNDNTFDWIVHRV